MQKTIKASVALLLAFLLALPQPGLAAAEKTASAAAMPESRRALHALNRLTFGPRPGDVERVRAMGVEKWIELQLHPEKINDSALEARLAPFRTLRMDAREMAENFPPPQLLRAVAQGRVRMPSDPEQRAIYESAMERYEQRQKRQAQGQNQGDDGAPPSDMEQMTPEERAARREARLAASVKMDELRGMAPEARLQAILKMQPDERMALARMMSREEREQLFSEFTPEQRETLLALINPTRVVTTELQQAKILRAVYSERQLEEVMTDFWFNHFNVFLGKGADRYLTTSYERDVIRPHALGKFSDLLRATAESPAMLFYLDNWQSVGAKSEFALNGGQRRGQSGRNRRGRFGGGRFPQQRGGQGDAEMQRRAQQGQQARRGLNENYARELMELHTLGVNGGYTQKDVTEVARVFTGWTIRQPRMGGDFEFNERMHEPGNKLVLGQTIHSGEKKEGEQVLEMLARHPATAQFISRKLAQRLVADDPPSALVERMAATFRKSDGDIREVLRTLFHSPEFWAAETYRAKVKTPLEFVASAIRATGADTTHAMALVQSLERMGMPLYGAQPPTGYSMKAETWVNSAALLNRMNFALGLGTGRLPGVKSDASRWLGAKNLPESSEAALSSLEQTLLAGDMSPQTHETIRKQLTDPQVTGRELDDAPRTPNLGAIVGLLLGSPEFQRH